MYILSKNKKVHYCSSVQVTSFTMLNVPEISAEKTKFCYRLRRIRKLCNRYIFGRKISSG